MLSITTKNISGDLPRKLEVIAKAGFTGVELLEQDFTCYDGTPSQASELISNCGLKPAGLYPFTDLEGFAGTKKAASFERLERKLDLVEQLGIDLLIVRASVNPAATAEYGAVKDDLAEAASIAAKRGLRLAYLSQPWSSTIVDEFTALKLIEEIDSPALGLCLNSLHMLAGGAKPAVVSKIPASRVFHVQLADCRDIHMDLKFLARHFKLLPGQGNLNMAGFVRLIAKGGYKGAWSLDETNNIFSQVHSQSAAADGYRALVNLLDQVALREPMLDFGTPQIPDRAYAAGYEFVEFAASPSDYQSLSALLITMGFREERKHVSKSVTLWRQGAVNIVVNTEQKGFAREAYLSHGPCVCDIGMRVDDAAKTIERASTLGASIFSEPVGTGELKIPAVRGVGGAIVRFIDQKSNLHRVWDIEFDSAGTSAATRPVGVRRIDHMSQTMKYEEMQSWVLFYISTFEMQKSPIVDVADPAGVILSQSVESPEGEVRLNLNGVGQSGTFGGAFLQGKEGGGVQHIAFLSDDIFETSQLLAEAGFERLRMPANYYQELKARYGLDDELAEALKAGNILYDREGEGEFFQIYSQPVFSGIFFEIVERRRGYSGYGAKNAPIRLAAQIKSVKENEALKAASS